MNPSVGLPPVELTDGQIWLRPLVSDDAADMLAGVQESGPELKRWLMWADGIHDLAAMDQFIREKAGAWDRGEAFNFAIGTADGGEFLGACGLSQLNWPNRFANVLYWTRGFRRGRGIAPAAVRLLAHFAFTTLGLQRLEILAEVPNVASQRVAEKAGATREGVLRNRINNRGDSRDAVMFSLVPGDVSP